MEEYTPGTLTQIKDNFRVYDNMEEGVKGYFEFIQLSRYLNLRGITDPETYLKTIKADGYACLLYTSAYTNVKNVFALIGQWFGARWQDIKTVSYTHLDVYKRQPWTKMRSSL